MTRSPDVPARAFLRHGRPSPVRRAGAVLLVCALVAAACGGGDDESLERAGAPTTTTALEPAPDEVPPDDPGTTDDETTDDGSTGEDPSPPPAPGDLLPDPGGQLPGTAPAPGAPPPSPPPGTAPTTAVPAAGPDLANVRVRLVQVATVQVPLALAVRPGHPELFVAERQGRVQLLDGRTTRVVLDQRADTSSDGERGLLGLAFSPDGSRLYVSYTDRAGHSRLDELRMGAGAGDVDVGSRRTVLQVEQPYANHNGGDIRFGPDGMLWFGLGDGGSGGDPHDHGQNPRTLLGTMVRIDPSTRDAGAYGIPAGNPFADGAGGRPEVWAYGLRNPWRFSFDRATDDLWIADVGQRAVEEVNRLPAGHPGGANFGWARLEGSRPFRGSPPPGHVLPVFEYPNDRTRCSITGGFVYRGERIPALRGAYVYGDWCESAVRALVVRDGRTVDERPLGVDVSARTLGSFGEGADGELYVLSMAGGVYRLEPAG